jgi:hypothetical protein
MMEAIRTLLFSVLLLCCVQIWPEQAQAIICQSKTAIVYANGIFNTRAMARDSLLDGLRSRLIQFSVTFSDPAQYEYKLAYADNGGATGPGSLAGLAQLYEAFDQKQAANDSSFWRWLAGLSTAPAWFKTMMTDLATATNANAYVDDATLQLQLNGDPADPVLQPGYRTLLKEGKRVVIVAHSQGNFYANTAYDGLVQQYPDYVNRLGIVAVATPDSRVAGSGQYVTVPEDAVIVAIRNIYPTTLPAKPTSLVSPNMGELGSVAWGNASDGHSFVEWYLAGTYTRNFILDAIVQILNKLQPPFANSASTIFASSPYPSFAFADASRCILDDTNHLGFAVDTTIGGQVNISVTPLSGTTANPTQYTGYVPAVQTTVTASSIPGGRFQIGILPIPSGVGIVYADTFGTAYYSFDNVSDDFAGAGTTILHLISYTWDKTTGAWSEQSSQLALPQHTMSVTNYLCPSFGGTICSGPLEYLPVSYAVPAYTNPVVYQDALYDYGGELDSPGFQSDMVFIGSLDRDLNGSWLVMSLKNGQLMTGATGVFTLSWDASGNIVPPTITVGVPGYVRLRYYDGVYLFDATSDNIGITTQ